MPSATTWLDRWCASMPGALYVHIPFCACKCLYCDFTSAATTANDPAMLAYRSALSSQLVELSEQGLLGEIDTAYVGGGTPTMLQEGLPKLVGTIADLCSPREVTCEANPESFSASMAEALAHAGATRVSLGVQSCIDAELKALGRIHDSACALAALKDGRVAGLSVSADLMCGIPLQTAKSWKESLEALLAVDIDHLSVYPLAVEEGTPLSCLVECGDIAGIDPDFQAECMEVAEEMLCASGMHRYEVASYAHPGAECQHNKAYWSGIGYLGLGTGASTMLSRAAYERLRPVMPQLPSLPNDIVRIRARVLSSTAQIISDPRLASLSLELELLDGAQTAAEDLMLGCRMVAGIDAGLLATARVELGAEAVDEAVESVVSRGLAAITRDGGLVPTHDGWLLGNELFGAMWNLAPASVESLKV